MKTSFAKLIAARKKRILKRLADARANRWFRELSDPDAVIGSKNVKYEPAERVQADQRTCAPPEMARTRL